MQKKIATDRSDLVKQGSGILTLAGANTYTGTTTINAGTLRLGAANVIADGSAVSLSNVVPVTFDLNNFSETIASLSGGAAGGLVTLGSGTLTTGDAANTNFAGVISGTGGLTKQGSGTFTLVGANTYTGTTSINDGTLQLGAAGVIADTSALTLANTAGAVFDLNNFNETVASLSGGGATGGTISLGSKTLTVGDANNTTFAGIISGSGGIIKQGSGILTLSGSNTYTGTTAINAGTIRLGASGVIADTSAVSLANVAGVAFDLNNFSETIASLSGGGALGGNVSLGSGTLTTGDTTNTTFSGIISGIGSLIKQGSGIFTLAGSNTLTGAITIDAGTLRVNNAQGLGTIAAGTTVNSGGTLSIDSVSVGNETVTLNDGTLDSIGVASLTGAINLVSSTNDIINANLGSVFTIIGNVNGDAVLNFQGLGTIVLLGNIGNTIPVTTFNTNANTTISGSIATVDSQTFSNPVTLTSDLTFTSTGGNVIFDSTINGGFNLVVNSAGIADFSTSVGGLTPLSSLTVNAGTINLDGGSIITTGNQTYTGPITVTGPIQFAAMSDGTIAINNGISGGQNVTFTGASVSNVNYAINGTLDVNNLSINAGTFGTNVLSLNTGGTQNWNINNNSGVITGISGVAGAFTYADIQNLVGGSGNDTFNLGGTVGGSINGGAGTNMLIADNVANTWNITGANTGSVTGVTGSFSNIQNLMGGGSTDSFNLQGGSVTGSINGGGGTNTLTANNGTNTWNITNANAGSVTNVSGGFGNIQNLMGGTGTDSFYLQGGSVTGSINGGGGTNTLAANTNVSNAWTISSTDAGTVTGVGGGFADIQNLTGGNANNTFTFADSAIITGTINGGSLAGQNTMNYAAYSHPIEVTLGENIFTGSAYTSDTSTRIAGYSNINNLVMNNANTNILTLPNKSNAVVINGALQGEVDDPLSFNGFNTIKSMSGQDTITFNGVTFALGSHNSVFVNGVEMFFPNFTLASDSSLDLDVSSIIQQPTNNAGSSAPGSTTPEWVLISDSINDNLNNLVDDIYKQYNADLDKIKINPFCLAAN